MKRPPTSAAEESVLTLCTVADDDPVARQRIDLLKRSIDVRSPTTVLAFGRVAEQQMARFADSVLDQVLARDTNSVHVKLTDLRIIAEGLAVERLTAGTGVVGVLFFSRKREVARLSDRFKSARQRIDTLGFQLENRAREINYGLAVLDEELTRNLSHFRDLTLHIRAADEVLSDAAAGPRHAGIDQLDRRIRNLRRSRTIALAMLPTIRQVQHSGAMLVEALRTTISKAIPSWKSTMLGHIEPLRRRHGLTPLATPRDTAETVRKSRYRIQQPGDDAASEAPSNDDADINGLTEALGRLLVSLDAVERRERESSQARKKSRAALRAAESEFLAHFADSPNAMPA